MKKADISVRVSTGEQADKGYSQRGQEERLLKYCEIYNLRVRKVILEDHSAKSFKRPAWTGLLGDLRKHKRQHRTKRLNESLKCIIMINNELKAKKEETSLKIFDLSPEVTP